MAVLVDIAGVGRGVLAERHCVRSTGAHSPGTGFQKEGYVSRLKVDF